MITFICNNTETFVKIIPKLAEKKKYFASFVTQKKAFMIKISQNFGNSQILKAIMVVAIINYLSVRIDALHH